MRRASGQHGRGPVPPQRPGGAALPRRPATRGTRPVEGRTARRPVAGKDRSPDRRPPQAVQSAAAPAPRRPLPPLPSPPTWPGPLGRDGQPLLDVKGMLRQELGDLMQSWGQSRYRGEQLFAALQRGATDFQSITVLPQSLRAELTAKAFPQVLQPLRRQVDLSDGTVKYLFRLGDGQTVETVLMRYRYGYTACVSSQVGCRMGCRFCASTLGSLVRNLAASEMVEQVLAINRELADPARRGDPEWFPAPPLPPDSDEGEGLQGTGGPRFERVSRVVVMGMGEPLENLDAVRRFLQIIHDPLGGGIGWRHLTVSTAGWVPGIDELAESALPVTLAVSLHAPNDELRDRLVPLNRRYPLQQLLEACRRYVARTGRRLTFEYVLIGGVNDLPEHARELARLLRGFPCHVNLIPLNPVPERDLPPSSPERSARFRGLLRGAGLPVTLRRQLGVAIDAACGQLRRHEALAALPPAPG